MTTVNDPAAEREPDHVTPMFAAKPCGQIQDHEPHEWPYPNSAWWCEGGWTVDQFAEVFPERIHFDADRADQRAACGFDLDRQGPDGWTTDPAKVKCAECAAKLATPVQPERRTVTHFDLQRYETVVLACGLQLRDLPLEHRHSTNPGVVDCQGCRTAALASADAAKVVEPERRTVSLEVLTDELRRFEHARRLADASDNYFKPDPLDPNAIVGVVLRVNGEATAIPDVDTDWRGVGNHRHKVAVLAQLLLQADYWADATTDAELLMPTPDVLAALDGRPDAQLLTAPVWVLALDIEPGMLLADFGDALLQRVDRVGKCEKPSCTEGASCVVLTFDGGEQHQSGYARTRVRIPASVTR